MKYKQLILDIYVYTYFIISQARICSKVFCDRNGGPVGCVVGERLNSFRSVTIQPPRMLAAVVYS